MFVIPAVERLGWNAQFVEEQQQTILDRGAPGALELWWRPEERTGGSRTAILPARRKRGENSTSSINGILANPPSFIKISRRTKIV